MFSTNTFNWVSNSFLTVLKYLVVNQKTKGLNKFLENVFFYIVLVFAWLVTKFSLQGLLCPLFSGKIKFSSWAGPVRYEPAHGRSLGTGQTLSAEADDCFSLSLYILPAPSCFTGYLNFIFLILPYHLHF